VSNINDLIEFRDKYSEQLTRFRNHVEKFLLDIEAAPVEQAEERIGRFLLDSRMQMTELTARMREYKWRFLTFETLFALTSTFLPFVAAAQQGTFLEAFGEGTGVISAVMAALSQKQLNEIMAHPLAYGVLFNQSFKLPVANPSGPRVRQIYL
jgi:hypothetical protein